MSKRVKSWTVRMGDDGPDTLPAEAGNHDCEYDSESEDARCPHCGLTSGEAVKYLERRGSGDKSL